MKIAKVILPFSVLLISGCSSLKDVTPAKLQFNQESFSNESISNSLYKLSESAEIAANAQKALAELANGEAAKQMTRTQYNEYVFQKEYIPMGMERSVGDIEWEGKALPLIKMVSEMAGYIISEPAHKPLIEPIVRINTINDTKQYNVIDVIRTIEASNKDQISIEIDEKNKIVSINYHY